MIQQRLVVIFMFILIFKYTVQTHGGSGNRRIRRQIIPVSYKQCPPGERFDAFSRCVKDKALKRNGGKFRTINIPTSSTEMVITTLKSIIASSKLKYSDKTDKGSTTTVDVILRNEDVTVKSTNTVTVGVVAELLQQASPKRLNQTEHSKLMPASVINTTLKAENEDAEVGMGNVAVKLEHEQLRADKADPVEASNLRQPIAYHQHHRCYQSREVASSRRSAYEDYDY